MTDPMIVGDPPSFRFNINQGTHFEWAETFYDDSTGAPFNFTAATWHAHLDIRTDSGALVAHLDDVVTPDGTAAHAGAIALDAQGHVIATLKGSFTATMTPTRTYQNPGNGWADQSTLYAELRLIDPTSEPYTMMRGTGTVTQEVTF